MSARSLRQRGFSLIEVVTAFGIVGTLAAIAMPAYSGYAEKSRVMRCIAEIRFLEVSISTYASEYDRLPGELSQIGSGTLGDPWGHPYKYLDIADSTKGGNGDFRKDRFLNPLNSDYDLYSMGRDGLSKPPLRASQSRDDVIRANNGGFLGLGADF